MCGAVQVVGIAALLGAEESLVFFLSPIIKVVNGLQLLVFFRQWIGRKWQKREIVYIIRSQFAHPSGFQVGFPLFENLLPFGCRIADFLGPLGPWGAPAFVIFTCLGGIQVATIWPRHRFVEEHHQFKPVVAFLLASDRTLDLLFLGSGVVLNFLEGSNAAVNSSLDRFSLCYLSDNGRVDVRFGLIVTACGQPAQTKQKHGGGSRGPWLLGPDHSFKFDFRRQQRDLDLATAHTLKCQTVSNAIRQEIVGEAGLTADFRQVNPLECFGPLDFQTQLVLKVFLKSWQLEGVAKAYQVLDFRVSVGVAEVGQGALQLVDKIAQHRFERSKNSLQVGSVFAQSLGRVPLQVFGFAECQFEIFGESPGEVVSTHVDRALHDDLATIGDHQC